MASILVMVLKLKKVLVVVYIKYGLNASLTKVRLFQCIEIIPIVLDLPSTFASDCSRL